MLLRTANTYFIDIVITVNPYGVLICTVHQVMYVLVEETLAHPVLFQVAVTIMMSLLHAVSTSRHKNKNILFVGEGYSSTRYTSNVTTCAGLIC